MKQNIKTNKYNNSNTKNAKRNKKEADRLAPPTIEEAKIILPPKLEVLPSDTDDTPTQIDREHYGATFTIEDDHVYTLRLGVHTYSGGLAAFRDDCAASCYIPTTLDREQRVIGLFFVPELYPAKYMDTITLRADEPFSLCYLWGSAVLENNNNAFGFPLGNDAIITEKDAVIILENNLHSQIHNCHRFYFDVLRIQVEASFSK